MMKSAVILLAVLHLMLTPEGAGAALIPGADYAGTDITLSDNDVLQGTFTNVGNLTVGAGVKVFVSPGIPLAVYAATITITGELNGVGRGQSGGNGGAPGIAGGLGFGGAADGSGGGGAGAANHGGGGGGYGDADGDGKSGGSGTVAAGGGGAGGVPYNSTSAVSIPLSEDDIFQGSGGGGGGGGLDDPYSGSGSGGWGGSSVFVEAGYVVISGTINVSGTQGGPGVNALNGSDNPGAGGGGSGGGILIRCTGRLDLSGAKFYAAGGAGGSTFVSFGTPANPGGGGGGGRIKLLYFTPVLTSVSISTSSGLGGYDVNSGYAQNGSSGTVSFGVIPSSPTDFELTAVHISSAAYQWDAKPAQEWGGPVSMIPALTTGQFRLYFSTSAVPFTSFFTGFSVSSDTALLNETGLVPNTTVQRFLTAYTDYGDSFPSSAVSTYTLAAAPGNAAGQSTFTAMGSSFLTLNWSSGSVSSGFNPSYTQYEISASSTPGFTVGVSTTFISAVSSSPVSLSPNTTYYFRVRARNIAGTYTVFAPEFSTATLSVSPGSGAFAAVHVDSFTFSWSSGSVSEGFNPQGTLYDAQISVSTDNFLTLSGSTLTTAGQMTFTGLSPGILYSARVRAVNKNGLPTDFIQALSTAPGNFTNLETPGRPEPPRPTARFSYDGSATFTWYPPSGSVPLFSYFLEIGGTPGGNDFLSGFEISSSLLSYSTGALVSGRTYYARVRAKSSAGVLGEWSAPGEGVAVWISRTQPAIAKAYNWPNPFDPSSGPTNIGFNLEASADVVLKIFTLGGDPVCESSSRFDSPGNKVITWSGRDDSGREAAPGGYVGLLLKKYAGKTAKEKVKIAILY
ncbi:MAG: hypothetical protein ABIG11_11150 [bacterium]